MSIITANVQGIDYEFTMRGEDDEVLVAKRIGETEWRDAFCFFRIILDDGIPYHDTLFAVMDKLACLPHDTVS